MAGAKKVPVPQPRPATHAAKAATIPIARNVPLPRKRPVAAAGLSAFAQANVGLRGAMFEARSMFKPLVRPASGPFAMAPKAAISPDDIAAVKRVIEASRRGKDADADAAEKSISDPVARKLAEWVILRSDNTNPPFQRYAAFINANPSWPHVPLFRRRAENALWNDKLDDASVLAFFANQKPTTAKGRYMLARALLAKGDRDDAAALVRQAWRYEDCTADTESKVLEMFGSLLTRADHKARMEQRFYAKDIEAGMRAANRLGGDEVAIGRARSAVIKRLSNAKAFLDAVPAEARQDPGYIFARVQWLRKQNKPEEAGRLVLTVPQNPEALVDLNQWWMERRLLVRKLLDEGDPRTAYRVARNAASPPQGNYRVDRHFTAGWIALRYLHDPKTAAAHFAHITEGTVSPYALARGGYWQGRAAAAMGQRAQAKAYYQMAAQYTATYYGQLARARLGLTELGLRGPPSFTPSERRVLDNLEIVRAAEILYALDQRDMLASIFAELGESGTDIAGMAALAEVAAKHEDGRAMLLLGQSAYNRGLPLDYYAYPVVGLPNYRPIAPPIEPAVAYSIARQESHFNQKIVSVAHAMGLMQVTPAAGIDTAKKYKVPYNRERLLKDPVYNMQMGAAELSNLLHGYNGSYILTFAGYNAGRGRVRQWIAAFGDPRDPNVDPVDWVERIPISETRNYVERIMENLQVYRARFGGGSRLMIEADLRRGAGAN
ncbi:MAG: transglycosylase SLT domain-containing protein [Pseudolabrys sp.]